MNGRSPDTVLSEMEVERAVVAEEASAALMAQFTERLGVEHVRHEALKGLGAEAVAVVRTGATVPNTSVVLVSDVVF